MNYIETPFNYTGSKFKLLEQLLPVFDGLFRSTLW